MSRFPYLIILVALGLVAGCTRKPPADVIARALNSPDAAFRLRGMESASLSDEQLKALKGIIASFNDSSKVRFIKERDRPTFLPPGFFEIGSDTFIWEGGSLSLLDPRSNGRFWVEDETLERMHSLFVDIPGLHDIVASPSNTNLQRVLSVLSEP